MLITITINILILILSFYVLALVTDEFFVPALEGISDKLKINSEVAGATIMAVGSSAPELFTAIFAVLRAGEAVDIGAGTIVGSAIFNILVIVGVSSLFTKAKLTWQPVIRDLVFYAISILALLATFYDGHVTIIEALGLIFLYLIYIFIVKNWSKWLKYEIIEAKEIEKELEEEEKTNPLGKTINCALNTIMPKKSFWGRFLVSIAIIGLFSSFLVDSGVELARTLGVSNAIIGLTVLAAGTSVPDLLSSMIVAKKGKGDMAIANAVGSNIFDILLGLGLPYLLFFGINGFSKKVPVDTHNLLASIFLLFATIVAILAVLIMRKWKIGKKAGWGLIFVYGLYILYSIYKVIG